MKEVLVDDREIVAVIHGVHQLLAHAHQRRRSARGEVEAPEELEPSWLGCAVDLGCGCVRGRAQPGASGGAEPVAVGAEAAMAKTRKSSGKPGQKFANRARNVLKIKARK